LVRLVKDINLVLIARRRVAGCVSQLANLIDAAIGGCIISITSTALPWRISTQESQAPQGSGVVSPRSQLQCGSSAHGHNARDSRLADALCPRRCSHGDAVLGERIEQGPCDVILPGHVGKALRTVFPG